MLERPGVAVPDHGVSGKDGLNYDQQILFSINKVLGYTKYLLVPVFLLEVSVPQFGDLFIPSLPSPHENSHPRPEIPGD